MFNFGHIPKICNSFIFMFAEFRFLPVQNGFACCKNIYIYIYIYVQCTYSQAQVVSFLQPSHHDNCPLSSHRGGGNIVASYTVNIF